MKTVTSDSAAVLAAFCGLGGAIVGSIVTAIATVKTTKHLQTGENVRLETLLGTENERARAQFQHEINLKQAERMRALFVPFVDAHLAMKKYVALFKKTISEPEELDTLQAQSGKLRRRIEAADGSIAAIEMEPDFVNEKHAVSSALRCGADFIQYMATFDGTVPTNDAEFIRRDEEYETLSNGALESIRSHLKMLATAVEISIPESSEP